MSARRFFQIHLSTAIVLMLVAAVLLWANVRNTSRGVKWDSYYYFVLPSAQAE